MKSPGWCMLSNPFRIYYGRTRKEELPMETRHPDKPLFIPPKPKKKRMDKSPVQH